MRIHHFLLAMAVVIAAKTAKGDEFPEAEFLKLHAELQPDQTALWRSVPWKTSVLSAQQIAAEQQKPIFIWAMDGHPLGCT